MNLYSLVTIKKKYDFSDVIYEVNQNGHVESLYSMYHDNDTESDEKVYFAENQNMLSSWMNALNLNDANGVPLEEGLSKLEQVLSIFYINVHSDRDMIDFLSTNTNNNYTELLSESLDLLKEVFETHYALCYLYPKFYNLMVLFSDCCENPASINELAKSIYQVGTAIASEVQDIKTYYFQVIDYVQNVFTVPYQNNVREPAYRLALLYHSYCASNSITNFYQDILVQDESDHTWTHYLQLNSSTITDDVIVEKNIRHLRDFLSLGIQLMLSNDFNLRRCLNCGGYFLAKYSTNQDYCNRTFSAASTCSEYAARKTYKEKLFENPISSEYTKSYNKLYARIRRKKVPEDTPLKEQLLKLRDEYLDRYEHTHKKDREKVWKEYIQKNKDLLG